MDKRREYYKKTISRWISDRDTKVLVVAGGGTDFQVFTELGFTNVTISNLDERMNETEFYPYDWSYQNAENLSFEEQSFDVVVIHDGLHHCHSPHRALLEMYRVAKNGVILFESRDSLVIKLMIHLGLTQVYEFDAVYYSDCKYGGVNNTCIPNFIYRWTEREIEKTINCYAPFAKHEYHYSYDYDLPRSSQFKYGSFFKSSLLFVLKLFYTTFVRLFPKQRNLFSCFIRKPDIAENHFDWLIYKHGELAFNKTWAETYYGKSD